SFRCDGGPRHVHSFPTRRSSDLGMLEISMSSTVNTNSLANRGNFKLLPGGSRWGFVDYSIPENPLHGFNFTNSMNPEPRSPYPGDRKSTRLNSSHVEISYAVFCF